MTGPKVLLLDIETAPNRVYTWGLFKQNVSISQIEEPGYTLCWAAKWLGDKKVMFDSIYDNVHFIEGIWTLLDEADIVIHYNGKKFDIPTLNKEFIVHDYEPPSPYAEVDLYHTCRSRFRFASNKLDYVAQQLGLGAKVQHKGMSLWEGCMHNDPDSWKVMKKYNKQDVRLLEPLYERLLPWIQPHPNVGLWNKKATRVCPSCGSNNLQQRGTAKTITQLYNRYHCQDCGKWSREKTTSLPAEKSAATLTGLK
jgi:predicted RNA-binding Zn-ribbon protein involved in translation (DUF1610 family)